MIVHLSGDKWVNTKRICSISKEVRAKYEDTRDSNWSQQMVKVGEDTLYIVWFESNKMTLSQTQGEELLSVLPKPMNAAASLALTCKYEQRERAERTLIGQMGKVRWNLMGEDAQYNAVSEEVERQEAMSKQAQEQTHG